MLQGVVSDFDPSDGVGLIESDDGNMVLFNRNNLAARTAESIVTGMRVAFVAHESGVGIYDPYFASPG